MGRQPRRTSSGAHGGLALAAAVLLLSGCGGYGFGQYDLVPSRTAPAPDLAAFDGLEAHPVADLSGMELGVARFFVGFGVSQVRPQDSTLDRSLLYDLNMVFDLSSKISLETLVGLWDIPDMPVADAGSSLNMVPVMASLQLNLMESSRWRAYLAGGGGWGFNDYDLGAHHRAVMVESSGKSYAVEVDDGALVQLAAGFEFYSTEDAQLNIGLEVRYVTGGADKTERVADTPTTEEADINLWLARVNLSWHF